MQILGKIFQGKSASYIPENTVNQRTFKEFLWTSNCSSGHIISFFFKEL